jgi:hypothetical protein
LEKRKETETSNENFGMRTPVLKTPDNINSPENFFQTQFFSKDQPTIDESKKAELLKRNFSKEIDIFRKILCENNSKTITDSHWTCQFWLKNK